MKKGIILLCLVLMTGCSQATKETVSEEVDKGSTPIISNLAFAPNTFSQNDGGGQANMNIYLNFYDADKDVSELRFAYTVSDTQGGVYTYDISSLQGTNTTHILAVAPVITTIKGTHTFYILVKDSKGNVSNLLKSTFVIID